MNTLSPWIPTILSFAVPFVIVSVISALTYWQARAARRWVRVLCSTVASLAMLLAFVAMLASFDPLPTLYALAAVVVASGVQTLIEAAMDGDSLAPKHHFARSFFTFLCTATISYSIAVGVVAMIARSGPTSTALSWNFTAILWGFLIGLIVAPLSISFYRRMFQSLHLRPGIDRPLREGEPAS